MTLNFDITIIGCGPGGMAAGRLLAKNGKKVAVIDGKHWGGTCLNAGCIPSEMFLAATAPADSLALLESADVASGSINLNYAGLQRRIWNHVSKQGEAIGKSLTQVGAILFAGHAELLDANNIELTEASGKKSILHTSDVIIATGSKPAILPGFIPDNEFILDSTGVLHQPVIPESICIIGGGAIGIEFGSFFHANGKKVTIIEAAGQLLPGADEDIAREMANALAMRGYTLHLCKKASHWQKDRGQIIVSLESGETVQASKVLVAVGRTGTAKAVKAGNAGCRLDANDFILVDEFLGAAPNIHAIGDCNGHVFLAHAASHQGFYVASKLLGHTSAPYASGPVPATVFGAVQTMRAGCTAREALAKASARVEVSISRLSSNPIAQAHANPEGFIKAIWVDNNLAGMAAIGGNVSQLVTAAELLVAGNYTPEKLDGIMMAHPSLDESLGGAIRQKRVALGG